jgi:NADP-dependent 3-hydroxy acid dehydrogenase YdfG
MAMALFGSLNVLKEVRYEGQRLCSPGYRRKWRDRAGVRSRIAEARATKIYLGARNPASLRGLFGESSKLVPIALDLTNPKQIEEAAQAASDITLLINNAGTVAFSGALAAKDSSAARQEIWA